MMLRRFVGMMLLGGVGTSGGHQPYRGHSLSWHIAPRERAQQREYANGQSESKLLHTPPPSSNTRILYNASLRKSFAVV